MVIRGRGATQIILILLATGGALAWGYWWEWGASAIKQPIEFPHKTHLALSLPCTTCHQRAEKDVVAGRPPTALCAGCHAGGDSKSQEIKKLREYSEKAEEIPWQRVWRLPSHVFFSHRVHVTVANLACQSCHGPMETLDRPPPRPLKTLTMDDCIGCHMKSKSAATRQVKVMDPAHVSSQRLVNDCNVCHR